MAEFEAAIDHVYALAARSPGFVWRLVEDDADVLRLFGDDRMLVNLSVWESVEALRDFAYRSSDHKSYLRRRREWFEPGTTEIVLWWVEDDEHPTLDEGKARLDRLRDRGPTSDAFTFRDVFAPPDSAQLRS